MGKKFFLEDVDTRKTVRNSNSNRKEKVDTALWAYKTYVRI